MLSINKRGHADGGAEGLCEMAGIIKACFLGDDRYGGIGMKQQGLCLVDAGVADIIRKGDAAEPYEHFSDIALGIGIACGIVGKGGDDTACVRLGADLIDDMLPVLVGIHALQRLRKLKFHKHRAQKFMSGFDFIAVIKRDGAKEHGAHQCGIAERAGFRFAGRESVSVIIEKIKMHMDDIQRIIRLMLGDILGVRCKEKGGAFVNADGVVSRRGGTDLPSSAKDDPKIMVGKAVWGSDPMPRGRAIADPAGIDPKLHQKGTSFFLPRKLQNFDLAVLRMSNQKKAYVGEQQEADLSAL